jgi:hypothetical protein
VGIASRRLDDRLVNVDVIHAVVGVSKENVQRNAVAVTLPSGVALRVMHPVDVLISRTMNVHRLKEKQNDEGLTQLALAIEMVRRHFREYARERRGTVTELGYARILLREFKDVVALARTSAAKKIAIRYGLHVADALPVSEIPPGTFWQRQWPHLQGLMSEAYRCACSPLISRK